MQMGARNFKSSRRNANLLRRRAACFLRIGCGGYPDVQIGPDIGASALVAISTVGRDYADPDSAPGRANKWDRQKAEPAWRTYLLQIRDAMRRCIWRN